jgi:N-methylhydantoinase A
MTGSFVRALAEVSPAQLAEQLAPLEDEARKRLIENQVDPDTIVLERFAECRYRGQEHTIKVPVKQEDFSAHDLTALKARFDECHEQAYAHTLPDHAAEVVNLRLTAYGVTPKPVMRELSAPVRPLAEAEKGRRPVIFEGCASPLDCPVYDRDRLGPGLLLEGPAIIEEWTSTTVLLPGQRLDVDRYGNLILTVIR